MIQSNELRIGNYFKRRSKDEILTVDIELLTKVQRMPHLYNGIPLTEQWLIDFGFEKQKFTKYYFGANIDNSEVEYFVNVDGFCCIYCLDNYIFGKRELDERNIKTKSGDYLYRLFHFNYVGLNHVHQLQNLYFALTGKELTLIKK